MISDCRHVSVVMIEKYPITETEIAPTGVETGRTKTKANLAKVLIVLALPVLLLLAIVADFLGIEFAEG